ncbi:SDR family oxidoreductase [Streptomyces sp. NPDC047985]|uniref:SDR family oxidoreductase n=1 Tax=unclassified Streptomyces TaxID=2593676 RepID=UPI00342D2D8D
MAGRCGAARPHLARSTRPSLILQSSVGGLTRPPLWDAQAASQAGQLSLTRSPAAGWARQGIRGNAVCPGWGQPVPDAGLAGVPECLSPFAMSYLPRRKLKIGLSS